MDTGKSPADDLRVSRQHVAQAKGTIPDCHLNGDCLVIRDPLDFLPDTGLRFNYKPRRSDFSDNDTAFSLCIPVHTIRSRGGGNYPV